MFAVATEMGRYIARAAWEEVRILAGRRPIAEVIADSATSPAVRQRLQLVQQARQFAIDSVSLKAGESFSAYSQLDRDTLVLVLSAARRDTLAAKTWWFPVVGRFPYKGFFSLPRAMDEVARLDAQGFDTELRTASAFSTLGWFNDPLLSTTLRSDSVSLVNTVIHELVHNTVFIRNHVDFNESLASFIGARGASVFYRSRGDSTLAVAADDYWHDSKRLAEFWGFAAAVLDSTYALGGDSLTRIARHDTVYATLRVALLDSVGPMLRRYPRAALERVELNNATLLARRVYGRGLQWFDDVATSRGLTLRGTLQLIADSTQNAADPFAVLRRLSLPRLPAEASPH
jgi:predicted aminopeptidase